VPIRVPSLRERPEDIPLLVSFFVQRICERNHLKHKVLEGDVIWELQVSAGHICTAVWSY
jgi:two-component system, NtrC family, nitrogen regulation response regulator NtrX